MKGIQLKARAKTPVLAGVSGMSLVSQYQGSTGFGEINASSKRDLLAQQQRFLAASAQQSMNMLNIDVKTSRELVEAAFNDKESHRLLGEKVSDALYITANRQGFMRKFLARNDVAQGSIPRFPLRNKNVTAVWSTSPTKVGAQIVRDKWFTPPELTIVSRPFITQVELNQSPGDVLQEKFVEANEAVMVTEDRLWYQQVNAVVGVDNNQTLISGQLTPYTLSTVAAQVTRWGMKAANLLIATDLWQDIIGNSEFYTAIDPVARHELLLTGCLGTIYGMDVISDAFRHPEHKVLNQGEFFVISDALHHGAYSDRGGIISTPTDISTEGIPGRGFVFHETIATVVANSRSVAKGIRV